MTLVMETDAQTVANTIARRHGFTWIGTAYWRRCPACRYATKLTLELRVIGPTQLQLTCGTCSADLTRQATAGIDMNGVEVVAKEKRLTIESGKRALGTWSSARSDAPEIPAYFRGRSMPVHRAPADIRFHPNLCNWKADIWAPSMMSAFRDATGEARGVHLTFLQRTDANNWMKHPAEPAKLFCGPVGGCAIWLSPAATVNAVDTALVCEGIETAISFAVLAGIHADEAAVMAAMSGPNMAALSFPANIRTVVIGADTDPHGRGQQYAARAALAYRKAGKTVTVKQPATVGDWNDELERHHPPVERGA